MAPLEDEWEVVSVEPASSDEWEVVEAPTIASQGFQTGLRSGLPSKIQPPQTPRDIIESGLAKTLGPDSTIEFERDPPAEKMFDHGTVFSPNTGSIGMPMGTPRILSTAVGEATKDPANWPTIGAMAVSGAAGAALRPGASLLARATANIAGGGIGSIAGQTAANIKRDRPVTQDWDDRLKSELIFSVPLFAVSEVARPLAGWLRKTGNAGERVQRGKDAIIQLEDTASTFAKALGPKSTKTQFGNEVVKSVESIDEIVHRNLGITEDWQSTNRLEKSRSNLANTKREEQKLLRAKNPDPNAISDVRDRRYQAIQKTRAEQSEARVKLEMLGTPEERTAAASLIKDIKKKLPLNPNEIPSKIGIGDNQVTRAQTLGYLFKVARDPRMSRFLDPAQISQIESLMKTNRRAYVDYLLQDGTIGLKNKIDETGKDTLIAILASGNRSTNAVAKATKEADELYQMGVDAAMAKQFIHNAVSADPLLVDLTAAALRGIPGFPMSAGYAAHFMQHANKWAFNHPNVAYNIANVVYKDMGVETPGKVIGSKAFAGLFGSNPEFRRNFVLTLVDVYKHYLTEQSKPPAPGETYQIGSDPTKPPQLFNPPGYNSRIGNVQSSN